MGCLSTNGVDTKIGRYVTLQGQPTIAGTAICTQESEISGHAQVFGSASISGKSRVTDYARVRDNAYIAGNTTLAGNAVVGGNAQVGESGGPDTTRWVCSVIHPPILIRYRKRTPRSSPGSP